MKAAYYNEKGRITLIRLLPALPIAWATNGGGYAKGLRARDGFFVDIAWDSKGKLTSANITNSKGSPAWVTLGGTQIGKSGTIINIPNSGSGTFVKLASGKGEQSVISVLWGAIYKSWWWIVQLNITILISILQIMRGCTTIPFTALNPEACIITIW